MSKLWQDTLAQLEASLNPQYFNTWIKPLRLVRIDRDLVVLEVPNQPPRRAADAESLTHEAFGYALPVSGLVWWVRGLPDPARAFEARHGAYGQLAQLRQDGWVIDYLQYAADARPRKLVVAREGLSIRLVADSWQTE